MSGGVEEFWTQRHGDPSVEKHDNFLSHPLVQAYISIRAFGSITPHIDAVAVALRERTKPGSRILSVGCGAAGKERVLARVLPDRRFEAMDLAGDVLDSTRRELLAEGVTNLELWRGDFNALSLQPSRYDIVLGLGAFHHVEALEQFWSQVRGSLVPGGWVLAQEYVGPSRFQWTDAQLSLGTRALETLVPDHLKPHHRRIERIPVQSMIDGDPSEAVRSSELISTMEAAGLKVAALVGAGGSLLQPVTMHQIDAYDPQNWEDNAVLSALFREEDRAIRAGELQHDFAMFTAKSD